MVLEKEMHAFQFKYTLNTKNTLNSFFNELHRSNYISKKRLRTMNENFPDINQVNVLASDISFVDFVDDS